MSKKRFSKFPMSDCNSSNSIAKKKIAGYIFLSLYIAATAFIFINSSKNAVESTEQSSLAARIFKDIVGFLLPSVSVSDGEAVHIVRKLAHFTEFACQGLLLSGFVLCKSKHFNVIYILFFGLLTACCDELIQLFPYGRSSQVSDIFIDFSGCIAAAIIYSIIYFYIKRKKNLSKTER